MSSPSVPQQPVYRKLFEVIKRLYHQVGKVMLSEQSFSINSYYILPVMVVDIHVFVAGRGMWLCDVFFSASFSLQCMCALSEGPLSQVALNINLQHSKRLCLYSMLYLSVLQTFVHSDSHITHV